VSRASDEFRINTARLRKVHARLNALDQCDRVIHCRMYKSSDCPAVAAQPRYCRSLSDRILAAVHQACDQNDVEIAKALLRTLEPAGRYAVEHAGDDRRRNQRGLVAAYERCWLLRNPETY